MKIKKIYPLASMLLLLTGCASYRASSLSMLPQESGIQSHQNTNVHVSWKTFDKSDCETYLGRDVLAEGYIPVQFTIRNNSNDPLFLSPDNFNTPLSPVTEVANTVHTNTSARVAGWGIGGIFFFPLFIPAFVDGMKSLHANEALDADYAAKALKEQTIQPHSSFNGVVFIPKAAARDRIEMHLMNLTTHEKVAFSEIPLAQR